LFSYRSDVLFKDNTVDVPLKGLSLVNFPRFTKGKLDIPANGVFKDTVGFIRIQKDVFDRSKLLISQRELVSSIKSHSRFI
jgi:hypothetical protein